jgi:putative heme-binding domain-containing protein
MKDGRVLFGMVGEETALSLKLVLLTGEQLMVKTDEVKKRTDAKNSIMPASFAYTLSAQDVADVSAWIMGLK